jgi:hypothetical protein
VVKSVLVVLVLAGFACAEDKPVGTALPPVCGAAGVKFDVKTDSERQTAAAHCYCFGFAVVILSPIACEITPKPVVTLIPEVATVTLGETCTLR